MVRPPSRSLVSRCLPSCFPLLDGVSAFPRSCLPLSPIVSLLVSFRWMASAFLRSCLPMSPLVFHCFPLSGHMCACVGWYLRLGWCVRILSHCLPMSHCLPLSPMVSDCLPHMCACVGWCARLPKVLSPLSPSLSLFLFPFVAGGLSLLFPQTVYCQVFLMLS